MENSRYKFRAWDGKKMFFVNVLNLEDSIAYEDYYWYDGEFSDSTAYGINKKGVLMQFTGLLDKVGKEIYESDIVRFSIKGKGKDFKVEEVTWSVEGARFWFDGYDPYEVMFRNSDVEVIGNIYKHGNLLKKEQRKSRPAK